MTSKYAAGKDVLSYCGRCKLVLSHIIVSMKDANTIYKVTCNTCKATHNYKDPASAKLAKKKSSTRSSSKKESVHVADLWMEAVNNATSKSVPYSIKSIYKKGDIVDHPKFGPGVVDQIIDNDKVSIIFRHDIKVLIHNRS